MALAVAFIAGWAVMMLEILGGRVLAPYFGYSIYQWGGLIGVVLVALSGGYYLGGRVGDRAYAPGFLLWSLILAAACILLVPPLGGASLRWFRALGPAWGAVAASAVLLGPASLLLATVSPIVVRFTVTDRVANAAGAVYAVSTVGSIGGTFFTAFYAIPVLGTRVSHFVAAGLVLLAVAGVALAWNRWRYLASAGLLLLARVPADSAAHLGAVHQEESAHNIIQVVDTPDSLYLFLNYAGGPQTVMAKHQVLTNYYYDYFLLGPLVNGGKKVLVLGVGGGTALRQLVTLYPEVEVHGVDLDAKVLAVAQRYFGLQGHPRIRLVEGDARWYVETTGDRYDIIDVDLYVGGYVPFYCATQEFFQGVRDRLTDRGVLMMNVFSIQEGDDLVAPLVRTVGSVFPSVFLIGRGNFILVASKSPLDLAGLRRALQSPNGPSLVGEVVNRALPALRPATAGPGWPIFTDDLNDVEFRAFKMFFGRY